jgi:F-type H+-transporting ATPase subunit b
MLTVIVTGTELEDLHVLLAQEGEEDPAETEGEAAAEEETGPNPISPEGKELIWGAGSFIVLALVMRFFLYPAMKKGIDARNAKIRGQLDGAVATKAAAESEVAEYQAALADVRVEAARRIDAARQTLDAERQSRLGEVNARIAERRAAAAAEMEATRAGAQSQVVDAAADVAAAGAARLLGRTVDPVAARAAAEAAASAGVAGVAR